MNNVIIITDSAQRNGGNAMARFRQYANEGQIKNLTNIVYRVLATDGGIIAFEPAIYSNKDSEETLYICSTGSKEWLVEHDVNINRLFFASCNGTDTTGKLVWALNPYNVELPRLVPHREF